MFKASDQLEVSLKMGGLGIHAVQIAQIMGARVIAADVVPDKLKAAEDFGAETVLAGGDEPLPSQVKALTDGKGADVVVECVGGERVSGILDESIECLKLGGRLVVLGYAYGQPLSVDSADLIYGQFSILGSRASSLQDVVEVVKLTESGRLKWPSGSQSLRAVPWRLPPLVVLLRRPRLPRLRAKAWRGTRAPLPRFDLR